MSLEIRGVGGEKKGIFGGRCKKIVKGRVNFFFWWGRRLSKKNFSAVKKNIGEGGDFFLLAGGGGKNAERSQKNTHQTSPIFYLPAYPPTYLLKLVLLSSSLLPFSPYFFKLKGGGVNHHHPSENYDFLRYWTSGGPKTSLKLEFVHCGPLEKNQSAIFFSFNLDGPTKFKNILFQKSKERFLPIFDNIPEF